MREYLITGPQSLRLELHPPSLHGDARLVIRDPHEISALTAPDARRALAEAARVEQRVDCPTCQGEGRLRRATAYVDVRLGQWYPDEVDAGPCDHPGCEDGQVWVDHDPDELIAALAALRPEPSLRSLS